MKILLASNAPWVKTGYGVQAASLARRLRDAGHKVTFYCAFGLQGGVQRWEGITCLPDAGQSYVDPIIRGHLRYTQPDLLITLFDIWPWHGKPFVDWIRENKTRWLAWFPVDAVPISNANLEMVGYVDYPVAMANFAEDEIHKVKPDFRVKVIPHGVEKDFGYTANGRREFRRLNQIPDDAFLFGTVGRNAYYPGRKGFDRLIRAFGQANIPNSYLYIHCGASSEFGSVPLPQIIDFYNDQYPGIKSRIKLADEYNLIMGYSQDGMNAIYSALDCYVQPTLGEGFGLPVLESQACGCAVIATDCTSMPEIVAPNSSQLVPGATEQLVPDLSHRTLIDIDRLVDSMREIAAIKESDSNGFRAMKATAGQWANNWDWDKLWREEWTPLLNQIERDITLAPPKDWHRGGAIVHEHEGRMRKRESLLKSPVVAKELVAIERLSHPNIIPILDKGTDADGLHWYDMPKYTPLRDVGSYDGEKVIAGVRSALEYLHEQGMAHRDICPENVVIDEDSNPYLIDFEWMGPCDGKPCVDFEPWECTEKAVSVVQAGMEERGFHTIVNFVRGLSLEDKRHGFKGIPYQAIDGVGERDCQSRWELMRPDVKGKRVLDIGCNLGWFVRKSLEEGAAYALGIDNDEAVIEAAQHLGAGDYEAQDLDGNFSWPFFDVGFALSVLQHLENPDSILEHLVNTCNEVYIEQPARFITEYMASVLKDADYCGESERGRPIYRIKVEIKEAVPA